MKNIKFALSPYLYDINPPKTSKSYLPDWYKNTAKFYNNHAGTTIDYGKTFKVCMPFADAMLSGYIFELWQDVIVTDQDISPTLSWKDTGYPFIAVRDNEQTGSMTTPAGYWDIHYTLSHPMYIQTPPGYSILVTQPFNRFDLPFMALTGIVDSDKEPFFPGNYSLFLKKGFSGIIESGTPILQILPFKRDEWKSEIDNSIIDLGNRASKKSLRKVLGWYRDNVWEKKGFE